MKLLVDAQLPLRLARALSAAGHDVLHTSQLAAGNRTPDRQVAQLADAEGRVVVTKDSDFRDSHLLQGRPARLLVVATGNVSNARLVELFEQFLTDVVLAFDESDFVEVHPGALVIHARRPR